MRISRRGAGIYAVVLGTMAVSACNSPALPSEPPPFEPPPAATGVLVGAGDIARCGSAGMALTAELLDGIPGTVFTAGDNAYMSGTVQEFADCYDPHWGRHKHRTRPVAGNHDYESAGAAPYYAYFGSNAGPAGDGYYSYMVGPWLILALNSEIAHSAGTRQLFWLREQLSGFRGKCAAAIWHRPLFTSGPNLDNPDMLDVWQVLYDFDVDVVINGHDHLYERFAPQDPQGRLDVARGLRQFTVGTGGVPLYQLGSVHTNSEALAAAWGVMVFTLSSAGYRWEFKPAAGFTFTDVGTGQCH